MKNKYAKVFAIVSQINKAGGVVTYQELVWNFTENRASGRTTSLSDLNQWELQEFERSLAAAAPNNLAANDYASDPLDRARKAVIAIFKSVGRSTQDAIAWAEKYGVKGKKKKFNDYNGQELWMLIQNAEKMKSSFILSVNKKLHGI